MGALLLFDEMPNKCGSCDICQGVACDGSHICSIKDKDGNEQSWDDGNYSKPEWCPLVEA